MPRKHQKPLKAKLTPDHPFFDIIEDAYRVFDYPKPSSIDVCESCCMYPEIERDFIARDMAHYQTIYRDRILTLPHISDIEALMQIATIKPDAALPL